MRILDRHLDNMFLLIALTTLVGLTHARGNGGICPSEGLPASPCSLPPLVFTTGIILNETNCNQQFLAESFREVPRVQWSGADPNAFYTFLFIGTGPVFHWGVSNIPGSVLRGDGDITPFHQLAGVGEFRVFSFPVAYTALFFIGQTYWTYLGLQALAKKLAMTKSYDEFLHWISIGLFFISNFVVLTHWIEAPAFVRYIARWKAVQDELSPEGLHLKMRHPIILSAVLLLPCVSGFICLQVRFTGDDETISLLALIPFISSAGSVYSFLLIWVFTLSEIRHLADQLYNKILQVLEEGCLELEGERMSWLGLSGLASSLGEVLGLTGLAVLATALITFVPTSYGILAFFFDHSHISASFWGLVFTAATCVVLKANLCDSAHRTTQKIGNNFSAKILKLNLTHLPQNAMNEINLFLQTMKANPPEIQMHGFVTVNRSLFVSFVSNTVTYLVVLLQFKASSLSIPPDRDTNLSSTLPPSLAQH